MTLSWDLGLQRKAEQTRELATSSNAGNTGGMEIAAGNYVVAYAQEAEQDWDDCGTHREWRSLIGPRTRLIWSQLENEERAAIAVDAYSALRQPLDREES